MYGSEQWSLLLRGILGQVSSVCLRIRNAATGLAEGATVSEPAARAGPGSQSAGNWWWVLGWCPALGSWRISWSPKCL